MRQIIGYYCWVKQVEVSRAVESLGCPDGKLCIKSKDRPPKKVAGSMALAHGNPKARKKDAEDEDLVDDLGDDLGDDPSNDKQSGLPGLSFAFQLDTAFSGDPSRVVMEYQAVQGDRREAMKWIRSGKGKDWRADALHYFLISLGAHVPRFIDPDKAAPVVTFPGGFDYFKKDRWEPGYKRHAYEPTFFTAGMDWKTDADPGLPCPETTLEVQCNKVVEAQKTWSGDVGKDATREALGGWLAVLPVVEAAGLGNLYGNPAKLATIELIGRLLEESLPPLAYFKKKYNVARPDQQSGGCKDIKPTLEVPGHPSYPSGHSTQAWLVAKVLSLVVQGKKSDMGKEAKKIADHRVAAGVHFPMDSDAGERLAEKLTVLLKCSPQFNTLLECVKQEVEGKSGTCEWDA